MRKLNGKGIAGVAALIFATVVTISLVILYQCDYWSMADVPDVPVIFLGNKYSGMITGVQKDSVEVVSTNGQKKEFKIDRGSKLAVKDKKVEPGMYVRVFYKQTNSGNIIKIIQSPRNPPELKNSKKNGLTAP